MSDGGRDTDERSAPVASSTEGLLRNEGARARTGAERWNGAIPVESSRNVREALRRLGAVLGSERLVIGVVVCCTVLSTGLVAIGPWLIGGALDLVVDGVQRGAVDASRLHQRLVVLVGVYALAWGLGHLQSTLLTGALQRTMYRLRETVQGKLQRLPLPYIDRHARGDLLSRVTNDIDNLAQSLQQSVNQILTSLLLVVAVAVMMFAISPTLTVVAVVAAPATMWGAKLISARARPGFLQQWAATGSLNSLAEEAITGHAGLTTDGRPREASLRFDQDNDRLQAA
ncbi:MAG: ABC transporter ATP-binding protein [Actinomycetes bacterium]